MHGGRRPPSELGVRSFELGVILDFACDFELFSFELIEQSAWNNEGDAVITSPTSDAVSGLQRALSLPLPSLHPYP